MTRLTFVDDAHIEVVQNLTRVQARLEHAPEPVVRRDRDWESTLYLNGTWSLRRFGGRLMLWYEDWDFDVRRANSGAAAFAETGGRQRFSSPALSRMRVLLAESVDGVNWSKPDLVDGGNVVLGGEDFGNVHAFSTVEGPDGRLRALFVHETESTTRLPHPLIRSAWSDDGRMWTVDGESPVFGACGPHLGDVINLSFDRATGEYLAFTRHPEQFRTPPEPLASPKTAGSFFAPWRPRDHRYLNRRRIWLSRSADFRTWTEPVEIIVPHPDADNLDESFYSLAHFDTGDGHLGFLSVLHEVDDTMDVWLVHSRDLTTWRRVPGAGPLLSTGPEGAWDAGMVNVCSPPIVMGDEVFVFYGGAPHRHDWWWVGEREGLQVPDASLDRGEYALGLARIRADRFAGLRAGERTGMLVTPSLAAPAAHVDVDAEIEPGGSVEVEILDWDGAPVSGPVVPGCRIRVLLRRATLYGIHLES